MDGGGSSWKHDPGRWSMLVSVRPALRLCASCRASLCVLPRVSLRTHSDAFGSRLLKSRSAPARRPSTIIRPLSCHFVFTRKHLQQEQHPQTPFMSCYPRFRTSPWTIPDYITSVKLNKHYYCPGAVSQWAQPLNRVWFICFTQHQHVHEQQKSSECLSDNKCTFYEPKPMSLSPNIPINNTKKNVMFRMFKYLTFNMYFTLGKSFPICH